MATPMISEQWARSVLPIVRKEWELRKDAVVSPLSQFFGVENSVSSVEYSEGIGAFDEVPEYNSSDAEGKPAAIEYDDFNPLYETTFTHKEYAKGVEIARKLWDDNRTGTIRRKAQTLGYAFGLTIAKHQSSVLNNAFSSTILGGDGKALCANDHPANKNSTTPALDNKGTTALSYDAVVSTLNAGLLQDDDRGNELPVVYDTLYVPVGLQATAYEITNALNKPGTADNDANFLNAQQLRVVVDPYLTDQNNWFMLSTPMSQMHLLWFWRVRPELALRPTSEYDLNAKYRGYMRYSFGWDDPRFIYGHEVA